MTASIRSRQCAALLVLALCCQQAFAGVNVVTTIRPLHFVAEAIVGERGTVHSLVDRQDVLHGYRPSPMERAALEHADLLVWTGPELEVSLARLLQRRAQVRPVISVMELPGLTRYRLAPGAWDPHVWLDPDNGIVIATGLTAELTTLDPANADHYRRRLDAFTTQINASRRDVTTLLANTGRRPYLVYHNAWQYFEKRFGLSHELALLVNPEIQPGMRDLLSMRQSLDARSPACLFMETDADPDLVDTMLGERAIDRIVVDPLGYDIEAGADAYAQLITGVARRFAACLYASGTLSGRPGESGHD